MTPQRLSQSPRSAVGYQWTASLLQGEPCPRLEASTWALRACTWALQVPALGTIKMGAAHRRPFDVLACSPRIKAQLQQGMSKRCASLLRSHLQRSVHTSRSHKLIYPDIPGRHAWLRGVQTGSRPGPSRPVQARPRRPIPSRRPVTSRPGPGSRPEGTRTPGRRLTGRNN